MLKHREKTESETNYDIIGVVFTWPHKRAVDIGGIRKEDLRYFIEPDDDIDRVIVWNRVPATVRTEEYHRGITLAFI